MTEEIELELKWRAYQEEVTQGGTNMTFKNWLLARQWVESLGGEEVLNEKLETC